MDESVKYKKRDGRLQCEIINIPDWEGFEKIVRFLEKNYGAKIEQRVDGPDARRWVLEIEGVEIEVHHEDPWGNYLVATSANAEPIVEKIGADLSRRLAGLSPSH